jgi:hypothetical protein
MRADSGVAKMSYTAETAVFHTSELQWTVADRMHLIAGKARQQPIHRSVGKTCIAI